MNRDHRESDDCSRFLWNWAATLGGRGAGGDVKQAADALRMRHCNRAIYAGQPLALSAGIGDIHTASARILQEIQFPLNALVDENALGEDIYVRRPNNHRRWWTRQPAGGRPLPHAGVHREGIFKGDSSPAKSSTCVLAGIVRLGYTDSIGLLDRPQSPRPAKCTSEEITPAVAD